MERSELASCQKGKYREGVCHSRCQSCKKKCSAFNSGKYCPFSCNNETKDGNKPEKHRPDIGYRDCKTLTVDGGSNQCRKRLKWSATKSGHYGHCSNNNERRDENKSEKHKPDIDCRDCKEKEIISYLTVDGNATDIECSEKEQSDDGGTVGCKGHEGDKRSKCWREAKTISFSRGRSMPREKSSDSHKNMKFGWKSCRQGRRTIHRCIRSRSCSIEMSRNSTEESGCQLFDGLQMKCNSIVKGDSTAPIDEAEKEKEMLHSACQSFCSLESSYVTKHDYCQCCYVNMPCCCNIVPFCHNRKRKHKHHSTESDETTTKVARTSDFSQHELANGCRGQVPFSCHSVCHGIACKDSFSRLDGTLNPNCKNFLNEKRCIWSALALGSQHAEYYVQSQDFGDIRDTKTISKLKEGSSDIYRKTSKLYTSYAGAKANFDPVKTENQEDQDLWLELSLKALQRPELKVEGASKSDLKLSLPDCSIELNMEVQVPSRSTNSGFLSSRDSIEHIYDNELPLESSNILFSVWTPIVKPLSLPQRMVENIPRLSFMDTPVVESNSNPTDGTVNMVTGSIPSIIEGKAAFNLDQNCQYSLSTTREPECTVLEESNLGSSDITDDNRHPISDHPVPANETNGLPLILSISYQKEERIGLCLSEEKDHPTSDHPIPANERKGLPPSLSISSHKEERGGLCLSDSQLKPTSTSDVTGFGVGNECDASELFQSKKMEEFSNSDIITDDSEDDFTEHSYFHEFPKGNNIIKSIGNITISKEVSHYVKEDPLHKSKNNYVQNTLLARSISGSNMKEFGLKCGSASLANRQRKDEVHNCSNMRGISLSRSHRNMSECTSSAEESAEGKCRIIEVSSSEEEFVGNNVDNVTLACKNRILQDRGCLTLVGCITTRGTDSMIPSEQEKFGHENDENFKFVDGSDEVLLSDVKIHKKLEFSTEDDNGNSKAVYSSRGIPSTLDPKHLNLQYVEALIQIAYSKHRMWDTGILCDLCGQGPSLINGEWYAWCCGYRLCHCKCTEDHQRKLKLSMNRRNKRPSKRYGEHPWSGKVHRLCGLWSSEVFEKDDARDKLEGLLAAGKIGKEMIFEKDEGKDKLEGLFDAVKRGKYLVAETRFASHTIVLRRLVRVKEALCQMVISNKWGGWKQVDIEKAKIVKDLIFSDDFWNRVEYALELTEPLMSMLWYADMDEPCVANIYDAMDSMLERMKSVIQRREQDPDTLYSTVEKIVLHHWNKMTTPLHLLAYALSLRYYSSEILDIPGRVPPYRDPEVAVGYKRALNRLFSDLDVASNVRREFVDFVSGKFAEPDAINDQSRLDAIGWWYLHGEHYMYLQPLGIKILSQECKDPECRRLGATLGCRVKNCRRSFHYPCAVKLASQLHCRMWEGCRRPVACNSHRHVDQDCVSAKNWKPHWSYGNKIVNPRKRNKNSAICYTETCQPHQNMAHNRSIIQDFDLNSVVQETIEENERRNASGTKNKTGTHEGNRLERDAVTLSRRVLEGNTLEFIGQRLICEDLSHGKESVKIPCTNDIDDAPAPSLEYITCSKFSVEVDALLKNVLANVKKQAKPCSGCYEVDIDDPKASISVHVDVNAGGRDHDRRIDWQGEPMLGRLPYDCYGLLQLGWLTIDVVECNSRCCCGSNCINRELQKGLQLALEVFKTKDRGWGVRTLEQIPRGKFVMEYVGEVLTQVEASKRGQLYAEYNASYLCNLDHPTVAQEDHLVIDGCKMSNVARFINHSCEGNLRMYRVYTETLDPRIFRIGLYACRDIEIGEELTYDYKYVREEPSVETADEPSAVKCFCQAKNCRQVLLSG